MSNQLLCDCMVRASDRCSGLPCRLSVLHMTPPRFDQRSKMLRTLVHFGQNALMVHLDVLNRRKIVIFVAVRFTEHEATFGQSL